MQINKKQFIYVAIKDFLEYDNNFGLQEKDTKLGEGVLWD